MKSLLIGIGGKKGHGKDTVASMFNYIHHTGAEQANYHEWIANRQRFDYTWSGAIVHFADPVKDNLSTMFNIPRQIFDLREFKDDKWFDIRARDFVEHRYLTSEHKKLFINDFKNIDDFSKLVGNCPERPCIKIRTLMQVYSTLMRVCFGENVWVESAIYKAEDIAIGNLMCLIPDVRYNNEAQAIKQSTSSTGCVIRVIRDELRDGDGSNHSSEECNFRSDYEIHNNVLINTFYKCLKIYKELRNENN